VFKSPQTQARDFFVEIDHQAAGKLMYPGLPYKLSTMTPSNNQGAPLFGQHNVEVYCNRLGYSKEDLIKMREAGVI
jgi:crotonobetainyl-CoA:carnitine CoA-transferase CaiB-like acyl-CoA transferase